MIEEMEFFWEKYLEAQNQWIEDASPENFERKEKAWEDWLSLFM